MVVIRAPKGRLVLHLCGSLVFVAIGAWFMTRPITSPPKQAVLPVVGATAIGFFGLLGGFTLRKLMGHRIAFIIDRRGIIDNSSAIPAGRIAWDEIVNLGITSMTGQSFVGIDVRDREGLYAKSRLGMVMRANANTFGFPVNIAENTLDRSVEAMCRLIDRYWQNPQFRDELEIWEERRSA